MATNQNILPLQNPYEYTEVENGYRFETDFGAIYELIFLLYPTVNESEDYVVYMFNIEQIRKGKIHKDDRIRQTVEKILTLFFAENTNAILVVMDTYDNKQNARQRMFRNWFEKSMIKNVEKYEASCNTENLQLHTMLFVERNNPFKIRILEDYFDLVKINFYS